jgi:DNA-binding MarR family transcriptional regulator
MSLIHAVRRMNQHLSKALRDHGSPLDDCQIVIAEAVQSAPGSNQTNLVQATHIDRSTLSSALRRMARKKLLTKKLNPLDSRANVVVLTPAGEDALAAALIAKRKAERDLIRAFPFLQAAE